MFLISYRLRDIPDDESVKALLAGFCNMSLLITKEYFRVVGRVLRVRNILVHVVSGFLLTFCSSVFAWVLPILLSKIVGIYLTGLVYSIVNLISAFFYVSLGVLPDFIGRKLSLILSNAISVLMFVLLSLWWYNPVVLSLIVFLGIIDIALYDAAARSLLAESAIKAGLGEYLGTVFSLTISCSMIAFAIGSLISGYLINTLGYSKTFTILLVLALVSLALRFLYEETIETKKSIIFENPFSIFKQFTKLRNIRGILHIVTYVAFIGFGSGLVSIYNWIFLKDVIKMNMFLIGLTVSIIFIVSGIFQVLVTGRFIDKLGPLKILLIMHILEIPMLILFANSPSIIYAIIFITILGILSTCCHAGYPVLIAKITTEGIRATAYSTFESIMRLTMIPAPLIGALLWKIDPKLIYYTLATLEIPTIIIITMLNKNLNMSNTYSTVVVAKQNQ